MILLLYYISSINNIIINISLAFVLHELHQPFFSYQLYITICIHLYCRFATAALLTHCLLFFLFLFAIHPTRDLSIPLIL